ncbi:glycosyltransferase [Oscillatoria salina]|uniref:glycosyltransferase n=1 Tax=Oscillatoria salina TaxID=331517 RepID=UPI0013B8F30E|nr:glycosyltransferase [Oscillatoria salina]MBZ8182503.1 glycosyltransferase [Oscillatoria salina IIICB1]NET86974.1 glycosyltransferase [Kamptonema sp. SIO1D9]
MNLLIIILAITILAVRIWKYQTITHFFSQVSPPLPDEIGQDNDNIQISILQPILSGDPTLWSCLSGNLEMVTSYQCEFLWLVDTDDEIGIAGCQELINSYPERHIRLLTLPPPPDKISPKTYKLIEGLKQSQGEYITVLDDDTILPDWAFEQSLPLLNQPEIGVTFGLPYYLNFSNLWSSLLAAVVNGNSLLTYIPYTYLIKPITLNGMFFVIKKEILAQINGFSGLENTLVDDHAIAMRFREYNYQLKQSPVCHGISTQVNNLTHYLNIINRWFIFPQASIMRLGNFQDLLIFYTIVLLPTCFPLLIFLYTLIFPSIYTLTYSLIYFSFSYWMLAKFNQNYLNQATPNHKIILLIILQILLPINIILSLISPKKINWRGHIMEIKKDGTFTFIQRRNQN